MLFRSLFDISNGRKLDAVVVGNQPTGLDISSDGTTFAFSNFLDSTVEIYKIPLYEELVLGNGGYSSFYKTKLKK